VESTARQELKHVQKERQEKRQNSDDEPYAAICQGRIQAMYYYRDRAGRWRIANSAGEDEKRSAAGFCLKRYEGVLCRPAGSGRRHRYHRVPCQIQLIVPRDKRACGCSRSRVLASHNPSVLLCFCNFLFLRPLLPLVAPRGFLVYSTVPVFAPKAVWVRQHMMPRFEFRLFLFKTNCRRV
jgi:hypothetical protein